MGFVSLSEDIQSRHESDIHDLLRELEAGHLSESKQQRAIPEFRQLVEHLGKLLMDPEQPAAMRLLDLRSRERNLTHKVEILNGKNAELATKNCDLNDAVRRLKADAKTSGDVTRRLRQESKSLSDEIAKLKQTCDGLRQGIADRDARIKRLEQLAFEAQAHVRYDSGHQL